MINSQKNKIVNMRTMVLCFLVSVVFGSHALADTTTVSDVAGLTNAIAKSVKDIVLKPGVYDLSTLKTCVVSNGSSFAWGTNCSADNSGPAHIVFSKQINFSGENSKHWSEKTPEEETIIRGAGESDTMRLIYGYTGGGRGSTWKNITFEGGNAGSKNGGAIFINDSHLTADLSLSNCVFRNNRATIGGATRCLSARDCLFENNTASKGGAMEVALSATQVGGKNARQVPWTNYLANCIFRGNVATGTGGGAIYAGTNFGTICNCVFTNNSATATSGENGYGGAIKLENCPDVFIRDCKFVGNVRANSGGAVYGTGNIGGFSGCEFIGNHAKNGGAVICCDTLSTIDGCTFVSNSVSEDRAALYLGGFANIANSTFAFNAAARSNAGIYVKDFAQAGTVENCIFESNTNSPNVNVGSHICGAKKVINCTFRGYGDMIAQNYDRCTFENCSCDYDNWGGGMLLFDSSFASGSMRNCLFANNSAHNYICNTSGENVEIVNCTFANNLAKSAVNLGSTSVTNEGYILYAHRNGNSSSAKASTNLVVNCIFANNYHWGNVRQDVSAYRTTTYVTALNKLVNCLYENGIATANTSESGSIVAGANFVAGDSRYPDAPEFMIRRSSKARKAGVVLDWMADATDRAGAPMVSEKGTVDVGAYQCTLPQTGLFMIVK